MTKLREHGYLFVNKNSSSPCVQFATGSQISSLLGYLRPVSNPRESATVLYVHKIGDGT